MADPLTGLAALSLADNVASFIVLALKISREAYRSADGVSKELGDVESVAKALRSSSTKLSQGLSRFEKTKSSDLKPSEENQELISIAQNCERLAKDLAGTIERYKVEPGPFRRLRSFKQALLAAWNKSDIEKVEKLLMKYEKELNTRIIISLKIRSEEIQSQNSIRHDDFQRTLDEAVDLLRSSEPQQDIMANDVQEIKQLLLRPHSPIPNYNPPTYQADAYSSPQSPLEPPQIMLPTQTTPLAFRDIKIRSTLLHSGARKGDIREVREALTISQVNIDARDEDGRTALHVCSAGGSTRVARHLCENGANVNVEDLSGSTPLHLAAANGHVEIVGILLSHGATDTTKDDDGFYARDYASKRSGSNLIAWMIRFGTNATEQRDPSTQRTALVHCATRAQHEAVKYLIGKGADVEARDKDGYTALMYASSGGDTEMIEILTSQPKFALNAQNRLNGTTALMLSAIEGHTQVLKLLIEHKADLELSENSGPQAPKARTAPFLALAHDQFEAADILLEAGASMDSRDEEGRTPLQQMAIRGSSYAISWLLKANAYIDRQSTGGWTALHEAANSGRKSIVELLLSNGASTELRNEGWGGTAFSFAAVNGNVGVMRTLADAGANINHMDANGKTSLEEAAERNHMEAVRFLLERGAYVDTRNRWSYTPLHRACQKSNYHIAKMLLEKGANPSVIEKDHGWTPLHEAINWDNSDLVRQLVQHGAKLECKINIGYTPLCFAASRRNLLSVQLLVAAGANVNALGGNGTKWTPLDEAAFFGHLEMAKFLLESGAHPDGGFGEESGDWGWTPLMRATFKGHLDVCKLLVEHLADIHITSQQGRTAISIASEFGKGDVLAYLRQQG